MLKNVPGASLATVAERAAQLRVPFYRPGCLCLSVALAECWAKIAAWIAANGVRGDAC